MRRAPDRRHAPRPAAAAAVAILIGGWGAAGSPADAAAGHASAAASGRIASASPDPRFLGLRRLPADGTAMRVTVRSDTRVVVRIDSDRPERSPREVVLEGRRRLDAVLRWTSPPPDAPPDAGRWLEVQVIEGLIRMPSGDPVRLTVGRRYRVRVADGDPAGGPARITPLAGDGAPAAEPPVAAEVAAEIAALADLLAAAGIGDPAATEAAGPLPPEPLALGLTDPRSIGERWSPAADVLARRLGLLVDGRPPDRRRATATVARREPTARDGATLDRLEVRLGLDGPDDATGDLLRRIGAEGPPADGSVRIEWSLLVPRTPGEAVAREQVTTAAAARSPGGGSTPGVSLELAGETSVVRGAAPDAEVAAALARAERRVRAGAGGAEEAGAFGVTEAVADPARLEPWGLSVDPWPAEDGWEPREPGSEDFLAAAVRGDGAEVRVLRPDVIGRHGFADAGLDEAIRRVGTAGPGFAVGTVIDLPPAANDHAPPGRARYGVYPGGERWFAWRFVADRPVAIMLTVPEGRPSPDRRTLADLLARVRPSSDPDLRRRTMAAHPGVLTLAEGRAAAMPPTFFGFAGADLAARGTGWRLVAWTVPIAVPSGAAVVLLDAVAETTGFGLRPDAATLDVQPIERVGRRGSAARTGSARLEVLLGDEDAIVVMVAWDDPAAMAAAEASLTRMAVLGRVAAAMPPVDEGPVGEAARAKAAAAIINAYGSRLLQMNMPEAALPVFERAVALTPGAPAIRLNRVLALAAVGRGREAAALIDADPPVAATPIAQRLRARISLEAGDAADARLRLERLLDTVADPEAAANLVAAVRDLDGPVAALDRGRRWMQEHGDHPMVLAAMSIVAADAGRPDTARQLVERAIELAPADASLRVLLQRYRDASTPGSP